MKKNIYLLLTLFVGLLFCSNDLKATHISGADLTYSYVGRDSAGHMMYKVYLSFYRNCCPGCLISGPSTSLSLHNPCSNTNFNFNMNPDTCPNGCEVKILCDSFSNQTLCNSGTYPGSEFYRDTVTVTLPDTCSGWTLSWTDGSRTASINNLNNPGSQSIYIEAHINNTIAPGFSLTPTIIPRKPIICSGGSDTLDVGAGYSSYSWAPVGSTSRTVVATSPGTYTVTVTSGTATGVATINIPARASTPTPTIVPLGSTTICQGYTVGLTTTNQSNPVWSNGAVGDTIYVSAAGTYTVSADSGCGPVNSAPVTVTVTARTGATVTPAGPLVICGSGSQVLTASAGSTYQWLSSGIPIAGATSSTYNAIATGNYSCIVYTSSCNDTSNIVNVQITNSTLSPVIIPQNRYFCGGTDTLDIGVGYSSYNWSSGGTSHFIVASSAGTYTVTVSLGTCTGTGSITLGALPQPTISPSGSTTLCRGGTVTLTSSATYGNVWSNGATTNSILVSASGTFTVTQHGGSCISTASAAHVVTISTPTAAVTPTGPIVLAGGGTRLLQATGGGSYQWLMNGVPIAGMTNSWYTAVQTGLYSCVVSVNGCKDTSNIVNVQIAPNLINNSVKFQNLPVPFLCSNTSCYINYTNGAVDADGDSLVYSLANPLTSANGPIAHAAGYTTTQPISYSGSDSTLFDTHTGMISFWPNGPGLDVITFLIKEYRNGILIGTVMRDINVRFYNCTAICIPPITTPIQIIGGVLSSTDSGTVNVCPGTPDTFLVLSKVPHGVDSLSSSINSIPSSIPGASFVQIGYGDSVFGQISWTPTLSDTGCHYFSITANVYDCPIPQTQLRTLRICVLNKVTVTPHEAIYCGTPIQITASGGVNPTWTPSGAGSGLSFPGSVYSPYASPSATTRYTFNSSCGSDTSLIIFNPIFARSAGLGGQICQNNHIQLNASVDTTYAPYSIQWLPAIGLTDPFTHLPTSSILNPIASPPTTTLYTVRFTASTGCVRTDTVRVVVNGYAPSVQAHALPTALCPGQQTELWVTANPPCGPASTPCAGSGDTIQVGTGASVQPNSPNAYPSPYGNRCKSARHQLLFHASELYSLLGAGGQISELQLQIGRLASNTPQTLSNFTIKMACVPDDSLPATGYVATNYTTVYTGTYTPVLGWNRHILQTPYNWDGQSNLVVDVCFDNAAATSSSNHQMTYTNTSFKSYWCTFGTQNMCGITGTQTSPNPAATAYYQRPNTKFVICVTPLSNANLQWTPNSGPNAPNPTNKDTTHATPVSSETYNVEYVDPNGCNSSDYISVSVDTGLRMVVSPHDSFSCNITPVQLHAPAIIAAGSTINPDSIFYTWTTNPSTSVAPPSGFGPSFANPMVNPGSTTTYICRINDSVLTAASCPIVDSAVIRRGTHLPVGKVVDSISCYGNTDGKIFINMTSGTAPYTYAWTPGGSSADSLTAIGAGTYTLLVTDQQGCTGRDTTILLNPAQLTLSLTSTDVSCYNGQNGTATALVNGGHSPYQYSWNPTQTNTGTLTSLSANTYQLTVTDLNSCTVTAQTTINQPTQLTSSATFSNLTGYNTHNGTIATHTLGGIAPYSYSWVHTPPISVGNVDSAWGLDSGTYIINITDHNGCTVSDTVVLIAPPPIVINITVLSNALCPGASTGSAYAIVSGGVPQYTYLWSNASSSTTDTVTGLSANTYSLTVTDHNGNTGTASTIITQPNPLYLRIDTSEVLCHGSSTGNLIDTSITGGTAPYTQFWNPAFLPNTAPGGMYILTVTDSNGCIAMDTAYLSDPPLLTAAIDISTPVTCYGYTNGTAHVLAAGGRPPYAYAWSGDTSTSALAISLSAGTATVTVTDFAGCTATASVNINQPTQLTIETIRLTNTHCATSHDGRAVAIDSGGVAPYTFTWDGTVGIDSITNLDQGQHTLLLTDASGCTATQTFNIDTIYVLHITMSEIDVTCFGGTNGNASTTVLNGTPAYTFAWSPSGGAQPSASNLSAGEQYVLVTDQYGCVTNDSIMVNQPNQIADTVYHIDPLCFGNHNGKAVVSIGNTVGPYSYTFAGSAYQNNDTVYNLASGIYAITITDGRGCTVTDADTLTDPTQLQMTDSLIHISCAGGSNGAIIIHAHGGTMPYTYTWTPPNTNDSVFSSLSQGQYTFTVTDAHGCQQKGAEQLQSPSPIIFTYIQSDSTSCADSSDGHIVVNVVGGTPGDLVPFTYSIDGINYYSNHNFYDLHAGTYTVYVKDSPGCVIDTPIVVGQPLALTVSIDPYDSVIALGGSITLTTVVSNFTTQAVNSHVWTPSVGLSCIDCANPVATPFLTTQYHLAVNYGKNCYTYADATVGVGHGSNVYIPNAFTPNGDGVNDVFSVYGSELSSVSMTVYNRWGEKIFDSGDNQWATWDGTYMGNLQSNGVYVYYVELTYLDGRKKTRQGSVTLIR